MSDVSKRNPSGSRKIRVFVSYDREHDGDLVERLDAHSAERASGFEIAARSGTDRREERIRRKIRESDEMIVICGEHTETAVEVGEELRIAREESHPYFLLWGRRERMCGKPSAAAREDAIYGWTREILRSQITQVIRMAETNRRMTEQSRRKSPAGSHEKPV